MNLGNIRRETPQRQTNKPEVINTWQGATVNWENDGKQRHQQTGQQNGEGANPKIWRTHWGVKWQRVKARKEKTETALMDSFATNDLDWIKPHLGPSIGLHHCTGCSHAQIDAEAVLQAVGAGYHGHECNCNKLLDHFHPDVVASQKAFLKETWWIPGQLRICAVLKLDASRKHTCIHAITLISRHLKLCDVQQVWNGAANSIFAKQILCSAKNSISLDHLLQCASFAQHLSDRNACPWRSTLFKKEHQENNEYAQWIISIKEHV